MLISRRILLPRCGRFVATAHAGNELVWTIDEPNLVVTAIGTVLPRALAGTQVASHIALGTSATAPALGDTTITDAVTRALSGHTFPEANQVTFEWSVPAGVGTGMTVREFGLLSTDGTLLARKVLTTPVLKDINVALSGAWTLTW